ncbi:MAG: sulfatase [Anaerolineae bacterium]|jgi:glucan phosphoethanolaminetransferase (alkaline phosphatase superfamily)|nr:sulfatase [Anaerolineae bacterium]MBT4310230.1 sulfatase [Anaerolineae bacterium]MBT4460013.1 sulfatase [Anaerolineae bacterium]MBT4842190.1 sulfatase [Anaerolineae bacterium]MBT6061328.1 sulfatase [Anaerolineae bacterium]
MKKNKIYKKTFLITILISFLYTFMEWFFFVTKPSFMWIMTIYQKTEVLLLTFLILAIPISSLLLVVWIISFLFKQNYSPKFFKWIGILLLSFILSSLSIILIDNFTYTVFGFGIVSTKRFWRLLYAFLFVGLYIIIVREVKSGILSSSNFSPLLPRLVLFLVLSSSIFFFLQFPKVQKNNTQNNTEVFSELPNIILLGVDGVNAKNMSAYGYERDTTPNIAELAKEALVAENAFSNSGNTGGSLTSLLTGKLPSTTGVVYPPDILIGEDAYQHLPAILKQKGYHTVQITMPSYGDAYDRNIRSGFDIANFRSEDTQIFLPLVRKIGAENGFYFTNIILQRIRERILHIFLIKKMDNPYEAVTTPIHPISEEERFDGIINSLDKAETPVFIHAHMLSPHGPAFHPREQVFSKGQEQSSTWMIDFYDDAILDFDSYFGQLFEYLSETGKKDNTIVILYSDHGMQWDSCNRVPLMIWFSNPKYTGKIQGNVQLLDIAPTILEYLHINTPNWMQGQSILANDLSPTRNIISLDVASDIIKPEGEAGWFIQEAKVSPPFYQLGVTHLVHCNWWYSLNLRTPNLNYGEIKDSTNHCDGKNIITPEEAKLILLENLNDEGYNISIYPEDIPINFIKVDK